MQDQPRYFMGQDGQLYPLVRDQRSQDGGDQSQGFHTTLVQQSPFPPQQEHFHHDVGHVSAGIAIQGPVSNRLLGYDADSAGNPSLYHGHGDGHIPAAPDFSTSNPTMFLPQQTLNHQQSHFVNPGVPYDGQYDFGYGDLPGRIPQESPFGHANSALQQEQYNQQPQYHPPSYYPLENGNQPMTTISGYTSTLPIQQDTGSIPQIGQHDYNTFQHRFNLQVQPQDSQLNTHPNTHVAPGSTASAQSVSPERSSDEARDRSADENDNGKKHKKSDSATDEAKNVILPPVKNACLACRAKKARCDGGLPICGQCVAKNRECQYVKSRRGGARKKKEQMPPTPTALAQFLKQLDDLAGFKMEMPPDMGDLQLAEGKAVDPALAVRTWNPDDIHGILTAYWEEIHPFQPLLPPVKHLPFIAARLSPDSPFLIAVRAILALCPNPVDPAAKSLASRAMRRSQAARLAQEASSRVEEMLSEASENDTNSSIECVQALALLGLYEFAQNGNPVRNRMRMNQAVQVAMEMGLHQTDKSTFASSDPSKPRVTPAKAVEGEDVVKDMSRRTWWVAFAAMLISGLVAGSRPIVAHDDKRIAVHYPACTHDDDSWSNWVESIGLACEAMDVIMTLDFNMPNPEARDSPTVDESSDEEMQFISDPAAKEAARKKKRLHRQMLKLDSTVLGLLKRGEAKAVIPLVPGGEEEVVRNQQLAASMMLAVCHIQLHRRQAFPEVALFSRKMCGLPKADAGKIPPTPEQPISVYSGTTSAFVSNESPSRADSNYAGSQMLSSYQDSGSLMGGSVGDRGPRNHGYPLPITPLQNNSSYPQQAFSYANLNAQTLQQIPMDGLLWDPALYPQSFPVPWFAMSKGAGSLYQPITEAPAYLPPMPGIFTAETGYIGMPLNGYQADGASVTKIPGTASLHEISPSQTARLQPENSGQNVAPVPPPPAGSTASRRLEQHSTSGQPDKPHKAWGVDVNRAPVKLSMDRTPSTEGVVDENDDVDSDAVVVGPDGPFPPGLSLQRCATAAHSVVRLEVLHRSATLAMWKGPPKWLPFCACGLVCGAYSFLLLCLGVQAGNFPASEMAQEEELEALRTNVKVILAGLQAYGQMWDGIDLMASEVKAALDAATRLPLEMGSSTSATPL